jgi:hypothetical protein
MANVQMIHPTLSDLALRSGYRIYSTHGSAGLGGGVFPEDHRVLGDTSARRIATCGSHAEAVALGNLLAVEQPGPASCTGLCAEQPGPGKTKPPGMIRVGGRR